MSLGRVGCDRLVRFLVKCLVGIALLLCWACESSLTWLGISEVYTRDQRGYEHDTDRVLQLLREGLGET